MWILLAIAVLLLLWGIREHYTDPDRNVTRPTRPANDDDPPKTPNDVLWRDKVNAEAPLDSNPNKYIDVLQKFYDNVYVPAKTKPTDRAVEDFLQSADAKVSGVDTEPLRRIILSSFSIERTTTAAAREEKQVKFQPSAALTPRNALNPMLRGEKTYTPADGRVGELPEGVYAPVTPSEGPRNAGEWDDKSASWTDAQFASVCPCAKYVL
jgi:hypothetical protein